MSSAPDALAFLREVVGPGPGDETLAAAWRRSGGDLAAAVNIVLDISANGKRLGTEDARPSKARVVSAAICLDDDSESEHTLKPTSAHAASSSTSDPGLWEIQQPAVKKAKLAHDTNVKFKQSLNASARSGIAIDCDWAFQLGTMMVQGYATNRVRPRTTAETSESLARPFLSRDARLELRWNTQLSRPKGRPGSSNAIASREGGSIRFDSEGIEVGKLPANIARTLVPLLSRQLISMEAVIGDNPPLQLEPGTSVPVLLRISLRSSALRSLSAMINAQDACFARSHSSGTASTKTGYKAVVKEEVSQEVQRLALAHLLELLCLPRRRSALDISEMGNTSGDASNTIAQSPLNEESDIEETIDSPQEMSSEVADQLGGREALERSDLPAVLIPDTVFGASLRTYQAQAVLWMWQRENPTTNLPESWVDTLRSEADRALSQSKAIPQMRSDGETQELHPMWDEFELSAPVSLPGRVEGPAQYLYYHRSSGALSLDFPHASLAHCRGGILADDMGLGKTVMCLALLSLDDIEQGSSSAPQGNEQSFAKFFGKSTAPKGNDALPADVGGVLVVAPVSLISQWRSEIEKHFPSNRRPTVHEYHGAGRRHSAKQILEFKIVLTTYGTLSSEREDGPLFQISWRRVLLDEAHTIKNRCSRVSQAAMRLRSFSRWCVTGTPLQNSIDELFALVKFLQVDPWSNWAAWRKAISVPLENGRHGDEEALQAALDRVRQVMQPLMLRRTKASKNPFTGELLVKLPPKRVHILEIEPSAAERDFYEALYAKAKTKFDTFLAGGDALRMYTHIFALIVKLRQALCHPFLVFARDGAADSDMDALEQRCLRTMVSNGGKDDGLREQFVTNLLQDLRSGQLPDCPICVDSPEDPTMTPCGHIFCRECALKAFQAWSGACPVCRREGALEKKCLRVLPGASRFPSHLLAKMTSAGADGVPENGNAAYSSKMKELLRRLGADVSAGCRAVVFSQWTSFLDLIGPSLDAAGIPWQRFDGSLSIEERRRRVAWLGEATPAGAIGRVFLCSLKAGGVGLNLVAANRLYLLDLWWNPAVEEQAIQRVHRIGQTSEVHVYKFVVGDSIDSDLLELQRAKSQLLENAIHGRSLHDAAAKLTLEDLKCLFNPCRSIGAPRDRSGFASDFCEKGDVSWIRVPATDSVN